MKFLYVILIIFININLLEAITLKEAVKMALENSEEAKIISENKKINVESAKQVSTFVLPQINSQAEYLEMDTNKKENPFFPFQDRTYKAGISISQIIWGAGKISASLDLEKNLKKLSEFKEIDEKSSLIKNISNSFTEVLYQKAVLNILEDRLKQRKTEFQDAKDLFDVGMVTHLDVREAELNLNSSKSDLIQGKTNYYDSLINFNLLLGNKDKKNPLIPTGNLQRSEDISDNLNLLKSYVTDETQRHLQMAKLNTITSQNKIKIANSEFFPSLVFVTSAETEGKKTEDMDESWQIGVRLEWNIFNGGDTSSKKRLYKAEYRKYLLNFKKNKKDLLGTINKLQNQIKDIDKQIILQEKSVKLAEQNYSDAKELYNSGQITLTRLEIFNLKYAEARFFLIKLYYLENKINFVIKEYLSKP